MSFTVVDPPPPDVPLPADAFEPLEPQAVADRASAAAAMPIRTLRGRDMTNLLRSDAAGTRARRPGRRGVLYRPLSGSRSLEGRQASSRRSSTVSRNSAASAITATSTVPAY